MKDEIIKILKDIQPTYDFEHSENFVEEGLLDSFDIVELVSDLEKKYKIVISALEIVPENFSSVEGIINLIKKSKKIIKN